MKDEIQRVMLNEVMSWWLRQILGLVPERWRQHAAGPANAIVFAWNEAGGSAELFQRRDYKEALLGRFNLDEAGLRMAGAMLGNGRGPAVVMRLPAGMLLERQVSLPLAAEQGLDRVLRYEMDRFTPFAADEVFFSHAVLRRDQARGRIVIGIILVPRARLAAALDVMAQLRLAPTLLEAVGSSAESQRIPLAAVEGRKLRWRRCGLIAAGVTCATLAITAVALPFWLQAQARESVEARIAELRPRVDKVEALRKQMVAAAQGRDVLGAEHGRVGDALHMIATLTAILTDDTHLTGLMMQKRQVSLEGQSAAAAKLLTTLSADPDVRNAAFTAPVTRNESGGDLFSIRAEITP